ncbi:hypothetical protein T484DRAFT_1881052 [Baffinella frigidus]|nr:hypothetical protein T484DRAFT_1881052 [Cryptophyta sp. CCMP2293]
MRASGIPPSGQENEVVTTHASMVYGMDAQPTGNDQPAAEIVKVGVNASSLSKASDAESKGALALASVSQLFRYASWLDICCMVLGMIASGVTGASQPVMIILFGDLITGAGSLLSGNGAEAIGQMINEVCVKFTVLGAICFVSAWIAEACFKSSGLRQSAAWRKAYIKAIVRQDVGWYDTNKSEELSSRVAESAQAIEEGISSKLSLGTRYFFQSSD